MKTHKTTSFVHRNTVSILFIVLLFLFSSCARKTSFVQSSVVPAAHGEVKVKKDLNRNYKIDIEVKDLAQVEKVYSRNHSYIVWMETEDGDTEKLGQLISSTGFLSSKRKAELETVSTSEPRQIFITAERNQNARFPGNKLVLRTRDF